MEKHTEGPWKWHMGRGAKPRLHIQTSAGYQIASTPEINKYETREADARLISAAPELLAALESMAHAFDATGGPASSLEIAAREQAREALVKAKA